MDPDPGRANSTSTGTPRALRMRWALPLAAITGLLYYAAFPGVGWWALAFIAFCPLLVALRGRSPSAGAALGLLSGTISTLLGFSWLFETLHTFSGFPIAVCVAIHLLLSVAQGGRFALFAALCCALQRNRWPWLASVAAAFITSEITYPLLFPWYFGASLHALPIFVQIADVGGPVLVGLPLVLLGALIADAITSGKRPRDHHRTLLGASAIIVPPTIYGATLIALVDHEVAQAPTVRIGMVQGNIPMLPVSAETLSERFHDQVARSERLAVEGADLVVWPESAFVRQLPAEDPGEAIRRTRAGSLGVPLLVGALLETDAPIPSVFNSALMLDRSAQVQGRYDKQHLLPFGEYLPFGERFPMLYRLSPASARISVGGRTGPLPFEDKRITVLICYEDILPRYVGDAVRRHRPHLLVNLTNDGWFGTSAEPEIHLALAKLRAIEHRRYLARVTNTGRTALVDPVGRVAAEAPPFLDTSLMAEARWLHGWTLYGWWGDGPWYAVVVATLLGVVVNRRGGGRRRYFVH